MTKPFPRALVGAIVALIAFMIIGAIVLLAYAGLPRPGHEDEVIARSAELAPAIDWVLGIAVMVLAGWWAARPFARPDGLKCAGLLGIVFVLLTLAINYGYGGVSQGFWLDAGLPSLVKLLAALAGGWLGARRGERLDEMPPSA